MGEIAEQVKTGLWVGDCFIYTNSVNRINYYVGGEIVTISHLDRTMYLLGYVAKDNRYESVLLNKIQVRMLTNVAFSFAVYTWAIKS